MSKAASMVIAALRGESPLIVRLLQEPESLPESFEAGFDQLGQLDPQWVWVAERRGQIVGCIVASPCHGVALIWRLYSKTGADCLLPMCRRFMADCRKRGVKGYMTFVDLNIPAQSKLQRLLKRLGGDTTGNPFTLIAGPLAKEGV